MGSVNLARSIEHLGRTANILIVDDDIDSALMVENVFSQLGCKTNCSLSSSEATHRICTLKADLIVLDWNLDHQMDANDVVAKCTQLFSKFGLWEKRRMRIKPKIVTYSALPESEIQIIPNPYFEYLGHWQKPLPPRDLLRRVLGVLNDLGG